jgi:hypothetical protein
MHANAMTPVLHLCTAVPLHGKIGGPPIRSFSIPMRRAQETLSAISFVLTISQKGNVAARAVRRPAYGEERSFEDDRRRRFFGSVAFV